MRSEGNARKNGEKLFGLYLTQVGIGQGFLGKEQYDNTGSSQLAAADFHPLHSTEMSIEGTELL
jgi:hypothetical protein